MSDINDIWDDDEDSARFRTTRAEQLIVSCEWCREIMQGKCGCAAEVEIERLRSELETAKRERDRLRVSDDAISFCLEMIAMLRRDHERQLQPYYDRLMQLSSLSSPPFFLSGPVNRDGAPLSEPPKEEEQWR